MFKGYKTYILAAITVVGAVGAFLVGDANLQATVQLVVTALMGAFIRNGIANP